MIELFSRKCAVAIATLILSGIPSVAQQSCTGDGCTQVIQGPGGRTYQCYNVTFCGDLASLRGRAPRAASGMQWQRGRYVEGHGDILTFVNSSRGECEGLCLSLDHCQFVEFHGPERRCNLFSYTPPLEPKDSDSETDVAFR